jgi:hypothetical protein
MLGRRNPSSIFNSDMRVLLNRGVLVGITAGALVTCYAFFVSIYRPTGLATNNNDIAAIAAERYLYDEKCVPKVLVGSSLVQLLPAQELRDVYNLGLPGQSSITGLEIVEQHSTIPKLVIIETTTLWATSVSRGLLDNLFSQPLNWLRGHIAAFRTEYKPTLLLHRILDDWTKSIPMARGFAPRTPESAADFMVNVSIEIAESVKPEKIESDISQLRGHTDRLLSLGASIMLLEMPVDKRFGELQLTRAYHDRLSKVFPADRFHWIDFGDSSQYETFDGFHLQPKSGVVAAERIWNAAKDIQAPCPGSQSG